MIKSIFIQILTWIWCFPQMLVGLLVKIFTKAKKRKTHYEYKIENSLSLGTWIFLSPSSYNDKETLQHELGHTIQSYILGWLWFPIIGIPSMIWCGCFDWYRKKYKVSYYAFYTEKWANKLVGLNI